MTYFILDVFNVLLSILLLLQINVLFYFHKAEKQNCFKLIHGTFTLSHTTMISGIWHRSIGCTDFHDSYCIITNDFFPCMELCTQWLSSVTVSHGIYHCRINLDKHEPHFCHISKLAVCTGQTAFLFDVDKEGQNSNGHISAWLTNPRGTRHLVGVCFFLCFFYRLTLGAFN